MTSLPRLSGAAANYTPWSTEEDDYLREFYPSVPISQIAEALNRSSSSVETRANRLRIRKIRWHVRKWSPQKFLSVLKVQEDGCWIWPGKSDGSGYGVIHHNGKNLRTHKYSYTVVFGRVVTKEVLHHICHNKLCVNPDHLEDLTHSEHTFVTPGTPSYNNRLKTHCIRGHEFSPENTYIRQLKNTTGRVCRKCTTIRQQAQDARKKHGQNN